MDRRTEEELYQMAAWGKTRGLKNGVRWLMRAMGRPASRGGRKVRARVAARGGNFFIDPHRIDELREGP